MYIDPVNQEYSEIMEMAMDTPDEEFRNMREKFTKARLEGKVITSSTDADQLRKLQDDLRKAGYKKVK